LINFNCAFPLSAFEKTDCFSKKHCGEYALARVRALYAKTTKKPLVSFNKLNCFLKTPEAAIMLFSCYFNMAGNDSWVAIR